MTKPSLKLHFDQHGIGPDHIGRIEASLGRAIARWQHVETAMFVLTHVLLGTSFESSSVVFFHIQSATQRLKLIDKLCRQCLDQEVFREEWPPLNKELEKAVEARNALAHFEITGLRVSAMPEPRETQYPVALSTHHLDVHAQRDGLLKGLYVEKLDEHADAFRATSKRVASFMEAHAPNLIAQMMKLPEIVRTHPSAR